jgi:hypothetical protein
MGAESGWGRTVVGGGREVVCTGGEVGVLGDDGVTGGESEEGVIGGGTDGVEEGMLKRMVWMRVG